MVLSRLCPFAKQKSDALGEDPWGRGHKMRCCAAKIEWFQCGKLVELWDEEVEVDCSRENESQSMTTNKTGQILLRAEKVPR